MLSSVVAHLDAGLALGGLLAGLVIGLTGMGGGALLTPLLVLVFHVPALAAVSSDLVVSLIIKPVGAAVHARRGTVRTDIVKWLALGSIPMAFLGAVLLEALGARKTNRSLEVFLGVALVTAACALIAKAWMSRERGDRPLITLSSPVRPIPTVLIGVAGGLIVGLTSVGSGSLMLVLMMWAYPRLKTAELVGTDLAQAIPLVASAALGHLLFGEVRFALVGALLIGALPGVYLGGLVSSRAPDRIVRPALATVLVASGLKLLHVV